jgi:hypothetical protein
MNTTRNAISISAVLLLAGLGAGYRSLYYHDVDDANRLPVVFADASSSAMASRIQGQESARGLDALLWKVIQEKKQDLSKSGQLVYLEGMPISSVPSDLTSVDASVAQALLYFDVQSGAIAPRHQVRDVPDAEFDKEIESIDVQLRKKGANFSQDDIADGLLSLVAERERRYGILLADVPVSSQSGYLAHLVQKHRSNAKDPSVSDVSSGIRRVAAWFYNDVKVGLIDKPDFDKIRKSLGEGFVQILAGDSTDSWSTVVGYVVSNGKNYVIVHEPRTARSGTKEKDFIPLLSQDRPTEYPRGVRFYSTELSRYKSAMTISKPVLDVEKFLEFLRQQHPPDTRR